jgi:hypothetical protein
MNQLTLLITYLLSSAGLTVLIVWPATGPIAWLRDHLLRRVLGPRAGQVLDCYLCSGFWCGLALSPIWWLLYREIWCWSGCLMVPAVFWFATRTEGQE